MFTFANIGKDLNLNISKSKTIVMAFLGKHHIGTKIILENKPIKQISHFNYLGCGISYEYDNDIKISYTNFNISAGLYEEHYEIQGKVQEQNFSKQWQYQFSCMSVKLRQL